MLAVRDLGVATEWFVRVLGCAAREVDPGNWTFCTNGDVTFMLGRCPDATPAAELGDHSYVAYLTVVDVDAFHRRAADAGERGLKQPVDQPWGMREMMLHSPDGHRFMIGEPIS